MYKLAIIGLMGLAIITANGNKGAVNKMDIPVDTVRVTSKSQLIYFGAVWCAPCKQMKQIFKDKKVKNLLDKLDFRMYDIDVDPEMKRQFQVSVVPTMIFIDKNGIMRRYTGAMSKESFIKIIESYI